MSKGCYVAVDGAARKVKKKYVVVDGVTKKVKKKYVVVSQRTVLAVELPEGYVQLDYVESTGDQYIDTGVMPSATDNRIVLEFEKTGSATGSLFGAHTSSDALTCYDGSFWINGSNPISFTLTTGTAYTLDVRANAGTITATLNGETKTGSYTSPVPTGATFFLCAQNNSGSAINLSSLWVKAAKIYKDNTLVRHYIPCKNPSGTVGMYDMVDESFASSGTSIDLVAGTVNGNVTKLVFEELSDKHFASTTPKSGVSYTSGISDLSMDNLVLFAEAISNNADITNTTSTVYIDYNNIHRKLSIGDSIEAYLRDTCWFRIIGFNHDSLTNSDAYGKATATGKAGITFELNRCVTRDRFSMNSSSTNNGGWRNSAMRTSTLPSLRTSITYGGMSIVASNMKPVNKSAGSGGGSSSWIETVSDYCFLLSEVEVFGSCTNSQAGEGTQYAYYRAGNSKKKWWFTLTGSSRNIDWWERSPNFDNNTGFCCVIDQDNGINTPGWHGADAIYGLSFAFCI